jgi:DNA-binding NtrC family response regulator
MVARFQTKSAARYQAVRALRRREQPTYHEAAREFETAYFRKLLEENHWRIFVVAGLAGLDESWCYRKLRQLGLIGEKIRSYKQGVTRHDQSRGSEQPSLGSDEART